MTLDSLLSLDRIVASLEATEHWPAIQELVEHLDRRQLLRGVHKKAVLDSLRRREEQISTGIGYGVAIPHAFLDEITEVQAIFGRSREGIEFDAVDDAPVNFIILFIVPRDQYTSHLATLAAIAKIFNNAEIRRQLGDAASAEEILGILSKRPARV
jgi:mannitol/fructose-specific phosphotransferase system IIA component (Ntr-type)